MSDVSQQYSRIKGVSSKPYTPESSAANTGGTGGSATTITLTADDITAIFNTWPSVRKLYDAKVRGGGDGGDWPEVWRAAWWSECVRGLVLLRSPRLHHLYERFPCNTIHRL